jgi:DNA-directed RNA polymerase subunit RPC12/RpoP
MLTDCERSIRNLSIKQAVIDRLKAFPEMKNDSSGLEYIVECPYCGHTSTHPHLYIKIDLADEKSPMVYKCMKCNEAGLVNRDMLGDLGIFLDSEDDEELDNLNKKAKHRRPNNLQIEDYTPIIHKDTVVARKKLEYFNERMGSHIEFKDAYHYNMILDIYEFLKTNNIASTPTVSPKMMDIVQKNYIGFLLHDRNTVVCRNIYPDEKFRYFKFKLNPNNTTSSFYCIKDDLQLLYTGDVHIHIAEGVFDILGVLLNTENIVADNWIESQVLIATCGFGYKNILRHLLTSGINTGLHLHIYADADKTDYDQRKEYIQYKEWFDRIIIHRNELEKDFGVKRSYIKQFSKIGK